MDSASLTGAPRQIRGLEITMNTAQNIVFLHNAGHKAQALRMAESDSVSIEQDWKAEATVYGFSDGSAAIASGQSIECAIPVQYTNGDAKPEAFVAFGAFDATDNAEPSSRVLDGSIDHGFAEEWLEPGTVVIDGQARPAVRVFLFDESDITEQAEDYPWDAEHCARILLRD
jgi:hypothetical protein